MSTDFQEKPQRLLHRGCCTKEAKHRMLGTGTVLQG